MISNQKEMKKEEREEEEVFFFLCEKNMAWISVPMLKQEKKLNEMFKSASLKKKKCVCVCVYNILIGLVSCVQHFLNVVDLFYSLEPCVLLCARVLLESGCALDLQHAWFSFAVAHTHTHRPSSYHVS